MSEWPGFRRWTDLEPFGALAKSQFAVSPAVDVSETEQGYEISADMPGMDNKDIEITLNNNVLTLKGEKKEQHETKEKDYYLQERSYGTFQRSFTLPDDVDSEHISTAFSNGVLIIKLPKSAQAKAKTRKIEVKAGLPLPGLLLGRHKRPFSNCFIITGEPNP